MGTEHGWYEEGSNTGTSTTWQLRTSLARLLPHQRQRRRKIQDTSNSDQLGHSVFRQDVFSGFVNAEDSSRQAVLPGIFVRLGFTGSSMDGPQAASTGASESTIKRAINLMVLLRK
jgi:hypothetical protein